MKTKLIAGTLLAASCMFAAPRIAIGVGVGVPVAPAPVYVEPAPAYVAPAPVYAAPPAPGPGFYWVAGFWGPGHAWHAGYWAPRAHFGHRGFSR